MAGSLGDATAFFQPVTGLISASLSAASCRRLAAAFMCRAGRLAAAVVNVLTCK